MGVGVGMGYVGVYGCVFARRACERGSQVWDVSVFLRGWVFMNVTMFRCYYSEKSRTDTHSQSPCAHTPTFSDIWCQAQS